MLWRNLSSGNQLWHWNIQELLSNNIIKTQTWACWSCLIGKIRNKPRAQLRFNEDPYKRCAYFLFHYRQISRKIETQKCSPALKTQYNLGLFDFIMPTMTQKMLGFTDVCQKVHLKMCSLSAVVSVFSFSPPHRKVCFLSAPLGGQAGSSSIQLESPRRYTFALTFYMLLKTLWDKVCSSCCAPQFVSGSRDTTIPLLHIFDQSNILCSFCCKTTDRGSVFLLTLCGFGWCKVLQSREQASRDKPPMMGHSTSLPCPGSKQLELLHSCCLFF